MAIEKREKLLYRITICFNWDPQWGPLEALRSYMVETGNCALDTESNQLVGEYKPNPAVDLTKEQAVELLNEKFGGFVDQLTIANHTITALRGMVDVHAGELATAKAAIAERDGALGKAQQQNAELAEALTAAEAALDTQARSLAEARLGDGSGAAPRKAARAPAKGKAKAKKPAKKKRA